MALIDRFVRWAEVILDISRLNKSLLAGVVVVHVIAPLDRGA
jgi:hypothetical protein